MTRVAGALAAATLALVVSACGGAPGSGGRSPAAFHPAASCPPPAVAPRWPTYQGDLARSGVQTAGAGCRPHFGWIRRGLDADVYAAPLVVRGLVLVATENDTIHAFDAATGQPRWTRHLAEPMDAGRLPCGGIRPISGITSTPVADPDRGLLYAVGFTSAGRHVLYEVALADGSVRATEPVDPPTDSPLVLQQRGALTLADGRVYIPYGGLLGDCGSYHGWIVGVPAETGSALAGGPGGQTPSRVSFRVPCDRECGIWAPAGPVVDSSGDLFVATGNGEPFDRYTAANSVLRLSPELSVLDSFAPSNWAELSRDDADLGSTSPALLPGGLVWSAGKGGEGYLLHQGGLGGIGGQAFSGPMCPAYGGSAVSGDTVYASCLDQLVAVAVTAAGPSFAIRWRSPLSSPGAPLMAGGLLWTVETGSGDLVALDPGSGAVELRQGGSGGPAAHFATPAAAGGLVYAVSNRALTAVSTAG